MISNGLTPESSGTGGFGLPHFKLQYNREEASELLSVSIRTLDRLISVKELTARRIGRRVLISKDVLLQFIKKDHPIAQTRMEKGQDERTN